MDEEFEIVGLSQEIKDFITRFGASSFSTLCLYPGYYYYKRTVEGKKGLVVFQETKDAWIGVADPIGPIEIHQQLIFHFLRDGKKRKNLAFCFPLNQELTNYLKTCRMQAIQIGQVPCHQISLKNFHLKKSLKKFHSAQALLHKDFRFQIIDVEHLSLEQKSRIDEVIHRWLEHHSLPPLGLLNRVLFWEMKEQKKYFVLEIEKNISVLLGAVPYNQGKDWYLVDLIRDPSAPVGASELMVLKAFEYFESINSSYLTLGMSPLVPVDPIEFKNHPAWYSLLNNLFENWNTLYHFKHLYQFKCKFSPDAWTPLYFVSTDRIGVKVLNNVSKVIYPQGNVKLLKMIISKFFKKMNFEKIVMKFFSKEMIFQNLKIDFKNIMIFGIAPFLVLLFTSFMFGKMSIPIFTLNFLLSTLINLKLGYALFGNSVLLSLILNYLPMLQSIHYHHLFTILLFGTLIYFIRYPKLIFSLALLITSSISFNENFFDCALALCLGMLLSSFYLKCKRKILSFQLATFLVLFFSPCFGVQVQAEESNILPSSHHLQYTTYGLFFEQQSSLLILNKSRAWGAIGGHIALFESRNDEVPFQFVLHGSANSAFVLMKSEIGVLTQTTDARVGTSLETPLDSNSRISIGWTHQSGHISDNIPDADLIGLNLGNEILHFRYIFDKDRKFRFGGGPKFIADTTPHMNRFMAEQFVEWFPWGASLNPRQFSPYLSLGLEETGTQALKTTLHAQLGMAAGDHFSPDRRPNMRGVLGYYNGWDPRLKYFQFKNSRKELFYLGLMFDL